MKYYYDIWWDNKFLDTIDVEAENEEEALAFIGDEVLNGREVIYGDTWKRDNKKFMYRK